ncbi:MAG: restriction endonuclease subunit S [Pseudonocardiaceae bacterium]
MSPSGSWAIVSVGEVCEFKYGKSLPTAERSGNSIAVFGSNGVVGYHNKSLTCGVTIVIGRKGSFGEVNYSNSSCWPIDTTYYVDTTCTEVDLRWLYYQLSYLPLKQLNKAAAIPGLNRDDAHRLRILLPPLPEQRRIAELLDRVDMLLAKRRKVVVHLDELAQSIFLDMFGDPTKNTKGYPFVKLGDLAEIGNGGTPSRKSTEYFNGKIPWVKTAEVRGQLITDTQEKISEIGRVAARCRIFPRGSIVIALYGQGKTRGNCAVLGVDAATNQACAVLSPSSSYETWFLFAQLKMAYARLRALGRGGNQANLNLRMIADFKVVLPDLAVQCDFVRRVEAIDELRASHRHHLAELDALFASLQHRAFRGEL